MKKNWYKIFIFIMIPFIAIFALLQAGNIYTHNIFRGTVAGTGFILQEEPISDNYNFDVDNKGNFYFTGDLGCIVVYRYDGSYLYTLPVKSSGGRIFVSVDNDNKIYVDDEKGSDFYIFNPEGFLINISSYKGSNMVSDNSGYAEQNGVRYYLDNGIITKVENGNKSVVFSIPDWQKTYQIYKLILNISIPAFVLVIIIREIIRRKIIMKCKS